MLLVGCNATSETSEESASTTASYSDVNETETNSTTQKRKGPFSRTAEDINLSDALQEDIAALEETFKEEMKSFFESLSDDEKENLRECKEDNVTHSVCTSLETLKASHLAEVLALLSDEEAELFQAQFETNTQERRKRRHRK
jgi:flagellar motility protein MotE (MotC chaperone)